MKNLYVSAWGYEASGGWVSGAVVAYADNEKDARTATINHLRDNDWAHAVNRTLGPPQLVDRELLKDQMGLIDAPDPIDLSDLGYLDEGNATGGTPIKLHEEPKPDGQGEDNIPF